MKLNIKWKVKKTLPLDDGGEILLLDMLGVDKSVPWEDVNRNVFRIDANGCVVWQIETRSAQNDRFPFTNIYFDHAGKLKAYCWDGGEYEVDFSSGGVGSGKLAK